MSKTKKSERPPLILEQPGENDWADIARLNLNAQRLEAEVAWLRQELESRLLASQRGQPDGVASLDGSGKVPGNQLPQISVPVQSVCGKTGDVALSASDVGARPSSWTPTAAQVGARPSTWMPSAADVGARPNWWTPSASDVGALPSNWRPGTGDLPQQVTQYVSGVLKTLAGTVVPLGGVEVVSYVGTGTYGQSNPCTLRFSRSPKVLIWLGYTDGVGSLTYYNSLMSLGDETVVEVPMDVIGQTYVSNKAPRWRNKTTFAKKTSDGKTFSWYSSDVSNSDMQFNSASYRYWVLAIY